MDFYFDIKIKYNFAYNFDWNVYYYWYNIFGEHLKFWETVQKN